MKKILILLAFLLLAFQVEGQVIRANPFARARTVAGNPELLTNTTFTDSDCWTYSGDWSIGGGVLNYAGTAPSNCILVLCGGGITVNNILLNNTNYIFECDLVSSAPGIYMSLRSYDTTIRDILKASANYTTGHITFTFTTGVLTATGFCIRAYGDAAATIDNVSLKVQ